VGEYQIRMELTSLSDLGGTGVLVVKGGDEEGWIAAGVDLVVDRSLREKCTLTFGQDIGDEASTVLFDESGFQLSGHEVKDLCRSGVGVGGIHAAWPVSVG